MLSPLESEMSSNEIEDAQLRLSLLALRRRAAILGPQRNFLGLPALPEASLLYARKTV
jgi:hypothetical protein